MSLTFRIPFTKQDKREILRSLLNLIAVSLEASSRPSPLGDCLNFLLWHAEDQKYACMPINVQCNARGLQLALFGGGLVICVRKWVFAFLRLEMASENAIR